MPSPLPKMRSLELKWEKDNKTKAQKRRLRYYYRHRQEILESNRSPKRED